jgi:hypothetical protein
MPPVAPRATIAAVVAARPAADPRVVLAVDGEARNTREISMTKYRFAPRSIKYHNYHADGDPYRQS